MLSWCLHSGSNFEEGENLIIVFFSVLRLMQTADVLASFKVSVQGNTVFYELMVQVQLPWWRLDE